MKTAGVEVRSSAYQDDVRLCETLRSGGDPGADVRPARGPAQLLRESYGVGKEDPHPSALNGINRIETMIPILCPDMQQALDQARSGDFVPAQQVKFKDGAYLVGDKLMPGTYQTQYQVRDCYWELSDANGNIIDNNFVSVAPPLTLTISESVSGFTTRGCGTWSLVE